CFVCCICSPASFLPFVFFLAPPATMIYPLSLHDALPIYDMTGYNGSIGLPVCSTDIRLVDDNDHTITLTHTPGEMEVKGPQVMRDRKSTRLNSSHVSISYAVFCLKKKIR